MGTSARAAKRVVLFVVEGPTEETALGRVFEKLLQNERVKFDVVHGDLTVKEPGETKSPRDCVRDAVLREIGRDRGYRWTDLERIVQICDTDGAFVPDEAVVEGDADDVEYGAERIITRNARIIRERNRDKSAAMRQLSSIPYLTYNKCKVPFRVYYFSRNMEHALHGASGNLTDEEKIRLAQKLRRAYQDDPQGFV